MWQNVFLEGLQEQFRCAKCFSKLCNKICNLADDDLLLCCELTVCDSSFYWFYFHFIFSNCCDLKTPVSQTTQMANICPISRCQQWRLPNNNSLPSRMPHTRLNRHRTWCPDRMAALSWQQCSLHKHITAFRRGSIRRVWFRNKELNRDDHWHHLKAQKISHLWVSHSFRFSSSPFPLFFYCN